MQPFIVEIQMRGFPLGLNNPPFAGRLVDFLNEKASIKAEKLVKLNKTSSALEVQSPSEDEAEEQVEMLKRSHILLRVIRL